MDGHIGTCTKCKIFCVRYECSPEFTLCRKGTKQVVKITQKLAPLVTDTTGTQMQR